jgi:hypothetical protein
MPYDLDMGSPSAAPSLTSTVIELLTLLISRRTAPGQGHVILSAAEQDDRVRQAMTRWHGEEVPESVITALRNELVHGVITTTNYDTLIEIAGHIQGRNFLGTDIEFYQDRLRSMLTQAEEHGASEAWVDSATLIIDNFVQSLVTNADVLDKLAPSEAASLARSAAERVLASARWSRVVGDRLDTTAVSHLLGITRQALAKRQAAGSIIGLPGHGTTWYPAWQFDLDAGHIRSEVRDIIGAFRDRLDDVDPFLIAAWATTPQDEDLDGLTPEHWIRRGRDPQRLREAAERAASHMSR